VLQGLFTEVAAREASKIGKWSPGDIDRITTAFAAAGLRHEGLMTAAADTVVARGVTLNKPTGEARSNLRAPFWLEQAERVLAACTKVGVQHTGLAAAVEAQQKLRAERQAREEIRAAKAKAQEQSKQEQPSQGA